MKKNIIFLGLSLLLCACSVINHQESQAVNGRTDINQFPTVSEITETTVRISTFTQEPQPTNGQADIDPSTLEPEIQGTVVGSSTEECIGTFEEFAYIVVDDYYDYTDHGIIYPGYPWQLVFELPDKDMQNRLYSPANPNPEEEIWIARKDYNSSFLDGESEDFLIYFPDKGEYITIPSTIGETGVWVSGLLFSPDGTIWGRNIWSPIGESTMEKVPVLSRFNRSKNEFEFDENSMQVSMVQGDINFQDWPEILIGDDGILWIYIPQDGLYRYDPNSGETMKKADIPDEILYFFNYCKDGNIYYFSYTDIFNPEIKMNKFSPESDQSTLFATIESGSIGVGMVMDHMNRIWLGTLSMVDVNGNQTILHPDYEKDMEMRSRPEGEYWTTPRVHLETSNGNLWFTKSRYVDKGTAWYNPETDEGCWFTTFTGIVYEDKNHQLWFLAGDRLYKSPIGNE